MPASIQESYIKLIHKNPAVLEDLTNEDIGAYVENSPEFLVQILQGLFDPAVKDQKVIPFYARIAGLINQSSSKQKVYDVFNKLYDQEKRNLFLKEFHPSWFLIHIFILNCGVSMSALIECIKVLFSKLKQSNKPFAGIDPYFKKFQQLRLLAFQEGPEPEEKNSEKPSEKPSKADFEAVVKALIDFVEGESSVFWSGINTFTDAVIPVDNNEKNAYGCVLLHAGDRNQWDLVRKLIDQKVSYIWRFSEGEKKDQSILYYIYKKTKTDHLKAMLKNNAGSVAELLLLHIRDKTTDYQKMINGVILALEQISSEEITNNFYSAINQSSDYKAIFLNHINDDDDSVKKLLIHDVAPVNLIDAIKLCDTPQHAKYYLDRFLSENETKPDDLTTVMNSLISRVESEIKKDGSSNWTLIHSFVDKKKKECEEVCSKALFYAVKNDLIPVAIALVNNGVSFTYEFDGKTILCLIAFDVKENIIDVKESIIKDVKQEENPQLARSQLLFEALLKANPNALAKMIAKKIEEPADHSIDYMWRIYARFLKDQASKSTFLDEFRRVMPSKKRNEIFLNHIKDNKYNTVRFLMDCGEISPESLVEAIRRERSYVYYIDAFWEAKPNAEQIEQLLDVAITFSEQSTLHVAKEKCNSVLEIVNRLVTSERLTPQLLGKALVNIIKINGLTSSRRLIKAGADLNEARLIIGNEPSYLSLLVNSTSKDEVDFLLSLYDSFSEDDWKKLTSAFKGDNSTLISILRENTVVITSRTPQQRTYLQGWIVNEAKSNQWEKINLLIGNNSSYLNIQEEQLKELLRHQDENGNTALHYAVTHKNEDMISLLLSAGADQHITNRLDKSPERLACEQESQAIKAKFKPKGSVWELPKRDHTTEWLAFGGDHAAIKKIADSSDKALALIFGYIYSNLAESESEKMMYKTKIEKMTFSGFVGIVETQESENLKALQDFCKQYPNALFEALKLESLVELSTSPLTLIYFVLQKTFNDQEGSSSDMPVHLLVKAKTAFETSIKQYFINKLDKTEQEAAEELIKMKNIVQGRLNPLPPGLEHKLEHKEEKQESIGFINREHNLKRVLSGDYIAIQLAANDYKKEGISNYGRALILSFLAGIYSVTVGDRESYKVSTRLCPLSKVNLFASTDLVSTKQFLLQVDPILEKVKNQLNIKDPILLMVIALEYLRHFPDNEMISKRIKESLRSIMKDAGIVHSDLTFGRCMVDKQKEANQLIKRIAGEDLQPGNFKPVVPTPIVTVATAPVSAVTIHPPLHDAPPPQYAAPAAVPVEQAGVYPSLWSPQPPVAQPIHNSTTSSVVQNSSSATPSVVETGEVKICSIS